MRKPKNLKAYFDSDFPDYVFCLYNGEVRVFKEIHKSKSKQRDIEHFFLVPKNATDSRKRNVISEQRILAAMELERDVLDGELRRLYTTTTAPGLARRFGVTAGAVRQRLRRIGLRRKEQPGKIHLTLEQTLWMRRNYPDMANAICALYLGVSESSVVRLARRMGLQKTAQFMREAQAHAAKRAKESHLRNGTYPPKGWYSPNLQKGAAHRFARKED